MAIIVAFRQGRSGLYGKAQMALAAGLALWLVGELLWSYYELGFGIEIPFPSLADAFWIAGYGPAAYYLYKIYGFFGKGQRQLALAVSTATAAFVAYTTIAVVAASAEPEESVLSLAVSLAYVVADGVLIVPAIMVLTRLRRGLFTAVPWFLLSLSILFSAAGDVGFAYYVASDMEEQAWMWDLLFNANYIAMAATLFWHNKFFIYDKGGTKKIEKTERQQERKLKQAGRGSEAVERRQARREPVRRANQGTRVMDRSPSYSPKPAPKRAPSGGGGGGGTAPRRNRQTVSAPVRTTQPRVGGGGGGGVIPRSEWHSVAGGESGWATPDPEDPDIIWSTASGSGSVGGIVTRMDLKTRQAHHVEVWPVSTGGWPPAELKYRFVWDAPLTISPHDHNQVYVGSQYVHVTTDGGKSWREMSPDLTLNDKSRQQISGGLTPDNIGVEYFNVVYSIAESRLKPGLIWAGTNDGLVHVTRDRGQTWTNVTQNIPNLPPYGTVWSIQPSRYGTGTAYIAVDFQQVNGRDPHLYKTTDYGRTWRMIVNGIPKSPLSYTHAILEDPVRRGLLYAGTENALYVSFNDGELWQPLQNNLPHAPMYRLVIQEHFNDLVVSTYGRGFWILDDLSPIQQLTPEVAAADAHLFRPRAGYRFRNIPGQASTSNDPTVGENPPYGASINYWLKAAPAGEVTVSIQQSDGRAVRTLRGTRNVGVNRIYWDLRNEPTKESRMRVKPLHADWVEVPPEGRGAPGLGRFSVLMPPGTYTVKLSVGGREYAQPLEVRKDPNSGSSLEEIQTQVARLLDLQNDMNAAVDMYNQVELIRAQAQALERTLGADGDNADIRAAADSLEQRFIAFEENVHQLRLTGRGQDGVRWPIKLAGRINYLAGGIASSDFAPTTQQVQVHDLFKSEIQTLQGRLAQLISGDLTQFNERLRQRNIPNIVAGSTQPRMVP